MPGGTAHEVVLCGNLQVRLRTILIPTANLVEASPTKRLNKRDRIIKKFPLCLCFCGY